jgi:hypothetical protein
MIIAFLTVLVFAGLMYAMGLINDVFHETGVMNDATTNGGANSIFYFPCPDNPSNTCNGSTYVNMTLASDQIFGQVNQSIQALRMVALVYILALAVLVILTNAMIKIHPVWFFGYMLICLLAVLFAPQISNAYETLLGSGIYNNQLPTFTASNFILLNLPSIVLVISVLGGVLLFVNMIRGNNEGNLQ